MERADQTELEQLAQQLHRPVMGLKDFSHLSQQDLNWLNQQLQQKVEMENQKMNKSLFQMPFFFKTKKI